MKAAKPVSKKNKAFVIAARFYHEDGTLSHVSKARSTSAAVAKATAKITLDLNSNLPYVGLIPMMATNVSVRCPVTGRFLSWRNAK